MPDPVAFADRGPADVAVGTSTSAIAVNAATAVASLFIDAPPLQERRPATRSRPLARRRG
jgi:hypothetical protein